MIRQEIVGEIRQFEVFAKLNEKTLDKYLPHLYYRSYKKNQYLFMEGDPRDKIFFLLEGYVMLEHANEQGSMQYLDFLKRKEMFPYNGLFTDESFQYTAIAATDIKVIFMQTPILETLLKSTPKSLLHVIIKQSQIIRNQERRMQTTLLPNAQERVLHSLLYLMEGLGEKEPPEIIIPCPFTSAQLAKLSGTTRETVSHLLNQLKRDRIISVESKKIRVHQPDYFECT
ncbi:Crp/Fnr family transcriptional regulator [Mesobacillus maritimus]|uniref:Crp/Fnr family transcriptional regulator n=1 Tax=Mesobacillus maritimus TaxID=1643336 RepID=UPI002040A036|nr:Crp/Fnr family transcriptional regulator [Mesobacillus maritimus]MCM3668278.1 Crp/Fnr family transcriptional regulator [Mesobacillus maritimus]